MLDALLDLVLPRVCAGCRARDARLCQGCARVLAAPPAGPVRPTPCPPGLPEVRALGSYEGPLQQLLLAHKEHGALHLSRPLGGALARVLDGWAAARCDRPLVLCPAPSTPRSLRARGYDHTRRLADGAARVLRAGGRPVRVAALLHVTRALRDQAGLSTEARAANLAGALRARGPVTGPVVVVDDVITTGATLVEARRALEAEGHEVLGAVVLAATRRRAPSSGRVTPLHPPTLSR